jgi:hypothetical protein
MTDKSYRCRVCERSLTEDGQRLSEHPLAQSQWKTIELSTMVVDIVCRECENSPAALVSPEDHYFSAEEITACRKEVGREIGMRRSVYPKWVTSGRMKQAEADEHLDAMTRAYAILKWAEATGAKIAKPAQP